MKRRVVLIVLMFLALAALAACGGSAAEQTSSAGSDMVFTEESMPAAVPEMPAMEADIATRGEFDAAAANQLPAGQERLIIRTADMAIVAADTEETLDSIAEMANNSGGWVVGSNVFQSSDTSKTGYIEIRVPSEGFQSVLDAIAGLAVEVTNVSTSGQDVTEEFVDLDARLGNLEATAARLRTFLDESQTVEEALAVNNELSRVEGEIEAIKGRMQYLQQSATFSSITVNVTPDELAQPIEVGGWQPRGVAKEAIESLANILQLLANAVIWLVIVVLPVVLVIAIPVVLIILAIRWWRRRGQVVETTTTAPPAGD
jgi:hypothetical protein